MYLSRTFRFASHVAPRVSRGSNISGKTQTTLFRAFGAQTWNRNEQKYRSNGEFWSAATAFCGAVGCLTGVASLNYAFSEEVPPTHPNNKIGGLNENNKVPERPDLPIYSLEEVRKHYDPDEGRMWVTFRGGVYDVTDFIPAHLGRGSRLKMAGGADLEPYWNVYRQHFRGHIVSYLEKFRIGSLSPEDAKKATNAFEFGDSFEEDPPRNKDCLPCTYKPFCGETRLDLLGESYFTPNELFYTRNHAAVPDISTDEYELTVEGPGIETRTFTYKDLMTKFKHYEVVATLQCAGNRGEDYHGLGKGETTGVFQAPHWNVAAIGNAKFTGVRMRDILKECGVEVDKIALNLKREKNVSDVRFESYDEDETGGRYSASVPFDKVVDPYGDCLVAFAMNDRPLPRDHGYPCRALIPGHAGARQPKWLTKISLKGEASPVTQCLGFAPDVTFEDHLSSWPPKGTEMGKVVQEMPVQSLVTYPPQNSTLGAKDIDCIPIRGIAWSGGGSGIHRVDVSCNDGDDFTAAKLWKPVEQHRRGHWGWYMFHQSVKLPEDVKKRLANGERVNLMVTSKAVDGQYNVQPQFPQPYVNARGVSVNHWYRVNVTLDPRLPPEFVLNPAPKMVEQGEFANSPSGGSWKSPWRHHGWEKEGESPNDWFTVSTKENVKGEPGISATVDWDYYRQMEAKPYYDNVVFSPTSDN